MQCDEVAAALVHESVSETKRLSIPGIGLQGRWEAFFWGQADGFQRLRLALELDDADTARPKGVLVSVDEGNSRFPVTEISRTNGVFRIEFKTINAVFHGEVPVARCDAFRRETRLDVIEHWRLIHSCLR